MNRRAKAACLLAFVAALFCLLLPPQAQASEEILFFHADIQVLPDGTLDVTETVRYAIGAGVETRGIDRDLSMNVDTESGRPARVTFTIVSVSRNGQPEPYRIVRQSGLARISVGPAEGDLPAPSEQLYEIRYRTGGRVQAFDGQDVLNWSVTGMDWHVPIRTASVTVTLPEGVSLSRQTAERGRPDGQVTSLDLNEAAGGSLQASADQALEPGEHFAISLAWQTVAAESAPPQTRQQEPRKSFELPQSWPTLFAPTLMGTLVLFTCWLAVGRDPKPGTIYPEFQPPGGIGPAEARYMLERGYDDRCLAAAVANMAAKGALRIKEQSSRSLVRQKDFVLEPLGAEGKQLTLVERATFRALFPTDTDLTLTSDPANGTRVDHARSAAASWLSAQQYGKSFVFNSKYALFGIGVAVVIAFLLFDTTQPDSPLAGSLERWFFPLVLIPVIAAQCYGLLMLLRYPPRGANEILSLLVSCLPTSWGLYYYVSSIIEDAQKSSASDVHLTALGSGSLFAIIAVFFFIVMSAPTKSARKLLDRLEGFALYLRTAEEARLKFFGHPENTPKRLERLRPYIIALGRPDAWTTEFANVLGSASGLHWRKSEDSFHIYDAAQSLIDAVQAATKQDASSRRRQRR